MYSKYSALFHGDVLTMHGLRSHHISLETIKDAFGDTDNAFKDNQPGPSNEKALVWRPSPNPQPDVATDTTEKTDGAPSNDDILSYIKTSITSLICKSLFVTNVPYSSNECSVSGGGDISKFKPGNFPWTSLPGIIASQGLVMHHWPAAVPMPGESGTSRSKGITILKKGQRHALSSALENHEITIVQIEGQAERRK